MDPILIDILGDSPALVGVVIVTWLFLRSLEKRDKESAEAAKERAEETKALGEIIGANTVVVQRCTTALERVD